MCFIANLISSRELRSGGKVKAWMNYFLCQSCYLHIRFWADLAHRLTEQPLPTYCIQLCSRIFLKIDEINLHGKTFPYKNHRYIDSCFHASNLGKPLQFYGFLVLGNTQKKSYTDLTSDLRQKWWWKYMPGNNSMEYIFTIIFVSNLVSNQCKIFLCIA